MPIKFYLLDPSTTSGEGGGSECNYEIILSDKIKCCNKVAKLIIFIRFQLKAFHTLPKVAISQDSQRHELFLYTTDGKMCLCGEESNNYGLGHNKHMIKGDKFCLVGRLMVGLVGRLEIFHFWLTCISNVSLWNGESIGPAVYWTFSTNHLSYTKTLVPIYIFRAITFFWWCHHFLRKNFLFAQKFKKLCRELFFEKP